MLDIALAEHFPELTPHLNISPVAEINGMEEPPQTNGNLGPKG